MQPQQNVSLADIHQILKEIPAQQTGAVKSSQDDSLPEKQKRFR
jgi:hypothetical protein